MSFKSIASSTTASASRPAPPEKPVPQQTLEIAKLIISHMVDQQGPRGLILASGVCRTWKEAAKQVAQEQQTCLLVLFANSVHTRLLRQQVPEAEKVLYSALADRIRQIVMQVTRQIMNPKIIHSVRDVMLAIRKARGVIIEECKQKFTIEQLTSLRDQVAIPGPKPAFFPGFWDLAITYKALSSVKQDNRGNVDLYYISHINSLVIGLVKNLDIPNAIKLTHRITCAELRDTIFCQIAGTLVELGNTNWAKKTARLITNPALQKRVLTAIETIFSRKIAISKADLLAGLHVFECLFLGFLVNALLNAGNRVRAKQVADLAHTYYKNMPVARTILMCYQSSNHKYNTIYPSEQAATAMQNFGDFLIRSGEIDEAFDWIATKPSDLDLYRLLVELLKVQGVDAVIKMLSRMDKSNPEYSSRTRGDDMVCKALLNVGRKDDAIGFALKAANPAAAFDAIIGSLLFKHGDLETTLAIIPNHTEFLETFIKNSRNLVLPLEFPRYIAEFVREKRNELEAKEFVGSMGIPASIKDAILDNLNRPRERAELVRTLDYRRSEFKYSWDPE